MEKNYLIRRIKDIKIEFVYYHNFGEARRKWEERKKD